MTIERLRPTFSFDRTRLDALRDIAPEAFADGKINWETLREALGEQVEEEGREAEHFGLFWPGKRAARRLAATPSAGTLKPAPGEGVDESTTRNLFIEGDNLEVLKLLQKSYAGRIKMIYIDPPYNTGNDFIYSDNFAQPLAAYLQATGQADQAGRVLVTNTQAGGRYHSNWLNMMYPRLRLARNLLRDDGVIFISIDDHEVHNLRVLMGEVFGEENFVATVIWQKIFSPKNTARHFSEDHDYIVAFARNAAIWTPQALPRTEEADARYGNPDDDPRGPWSSSDLTARNYYGDGKYEVVGPTGKHFTPTLGAYWRINSARFQELDADGRVWWGADGNNMPRLKRFLSEVKQGIVPQTLWKYEDVGHTQEAKRELLEFVKFEDTDNVLDTVKPSRLLQRMLQIATTTDGGGIVLDFFAGSATTAHAVLKKNQEDHGDRRFIMVQYPESLPKPEPVLKAITDIGKERIRNVIESLQAEQQGKEPQESKTPLDLGFRVLKLDRSNFQAWQDFDGGDMAQLQALFDAFESPLTAGWQPQDLLAEILLLEGFPLDSTITSAAAATVNTVQVVTSDLVDHRLFVCLDAQIAEETLTPEALASLAMNNEDIFVCLDSALSDAAKVRLEDSRRVKVI